MKRLLAFALGASLLCAPAYAGTVSGVAGTLDVTLVGPNGAPAGFVQTTTSFLSAGGNLLGVSPATPLPVIDQALLNSLAASPPAVASVAINVTTATTTQLVALSAGNAIYVSHFDFMATLADNVTLEYGTGTNCATGTTPLTGAYPASANGGISAGNGGATIAFVPAGNALCIVTSAATQLSGLVSYVQQ